MKHSNRHIVLTADVIVTILLHTLKMGKSLVDDGISAEHILYASFSFLTELHTLFQSMLKHSFVPSQFSRGTIVPLVKDNQGNRGDLSNYRGITISPIISKVFKQRTCSQTCRS